MVDPKSKDDTTTPGSTAGLSKLYDAVDENFIKTVKELTKVYPKYEQSVSSLQLDFVDSVKDTIHNAILAQKRIASGWNVPEVYTQEFVNQLNEITKNITSAIDVSNQLTVKSLDAIVENFRIFKQTISSFTEFTSNAAKAWNSLYSAQQQQFLKQ